MENKKTILQNCRIDESDVLTLSYDRTKNEAHILLNGAPASDFDVENALQITPDELYGFMWRDDVGERPYPLRVYGREDVIRIRFLCCVNYAQAKKVERQRATKKLVRVG
ncbi:MAG: hypothetical protein RR415_06095 [Ruthenibacterium sp.]